jgi:hypothetical protein
MARRSHDVPAWRAFGAALGAFAIAIQLLLSGWLIGHVAWAADEADLSVICAHDPGAIPDRDGIPAPASQHQCPACACLHSAKLLAPPPASPTFLVLRPRSEPLRTYPDVVATEPRLHSPYASRAPPLSA